MDNTTIFFICLGIFVVWCVLKSRNTAIKSVKRVQDTAPPKKSSSSDGSYLENDPVQRSINMTDININD